MAENLDALEHEVAKLIIEHTGIGYELLPGGVVNPDSIGLHAHGAAHVIVHRLRADGDRLRAMIEDACKVFDHYDLPEHAFHYRRILNRPEGDTEK